MIRKFLLSFFVLLAGLFSGSPEILAQPGSQAQNGMDIPQRPVEQSLSMEIPRIKSSGWTEASKADFIQKFMERKGPNLKKKLDKDRSRRFFLISFAAAIVLWGLYIAIYFATIDATVSSSLLALGGICGILGIMAAAAAIIGFVVWMIALSQGW